MYRREVTTLPIPPAIREKLLTHGFRTVADLEGIGPVELSNGGDLSVLYIYTRAGSGMDAGAGAGVLI